MRTATSLKTAAFGIAWNGENRMVAVESKINENRAKRLKFGYDYLGRRFMKKIANFDGTKYVLSESINSVYDGWNMIRETKTEGGKCG